MPSLRARGLALSWRLTARLYLCKLISGYPHPRRWQYVVSNGKGRERRIIGAAAGGAIGASVGAAIGGPVGAAVGALIASLLGHELGKASVRRQ